jgi:DNA-binding response OmpR family regulator
MKKILFIEDESALQQALSKYLSDNGYRVLSAMDGESGLRLAKDEMPDLIMLDLILPKKDGFEVLKILKKDETTKDIPVIVLTNLGGTADIEKAISFGATTYLIKTNYRLEEVAERIKQILEK